MSTDFVCARCKKPAGNCIYTQDTLGQFYHWTCSIFGVADRNFTSEDVKALRTSSGHGMAACQRALLRAAGDVKMAEEYLRVSGF